MLYQNEFHRTGETYFSLKFKLSSVIHTTDSPNSDFLAVSVAGTDLMIWELRAKVFFGIPSPQTKDCGWLIE